MTLANGTKLGPYEIIAPLGAGGMGEVYRARDTRLDRDVAIKVLPELMARDTERVLRFEREAKLLASLNHPNIAAIYGFETHPRAAGFSPRDATEDEGATTSDSSRRLNPAVQDRRVEPALHFLVLEYVEGETLAQRLKRGPLLVEDAIETSEQIAEALEAAHEKGVIHRDLKPGNVMIRPDGSAKVLDFGLARAMAADSAVSGTMHQSPTLAAYSPTITADFTRPGVILGTAAYMSPEQARGRSLDKRTDIWSFGVILYEALTGTTTFHGETVTDSMGAVLHKEPDWSILPDETPPTVRLLLRRCLVKDRKRRLQDIGDARVELEEAIADPSGSSLHFPSSIGEARPTAAARTAVRVLAAALLVALGTTVGLLLSPAPPAPPRLEAQIPTPPDTRVLFAGDVAGPAVVSPDGRRIAFVGQKSGESHRIFLRDLSGSQSRALSGTEDAVFPFWSPDGKSLGFFARGKLKRVDIGTAMTTTICDAPNGRGGSWARDGHILFSPDFQVPIYRVSASGGTAEPVTKIDTRRHTSHRWPYAVEDGRRFLFTAVTHDPGRAENCAVMLGSIDGAVPVELLRSLFNAEYVDGYMLWVREGSLLATPLDLETGRFQGDPIAILRGVASDASTWRASFSASERLIAYHQIPGEGLESSDSPALGVGAEATRIVMYDRFGQERQIIADGLSQVNFRLSPDGQRVAVSVGRAAGYDLWIHEPTRMEPEDPASAPSRLTFLPGAEVSPVWSPDGTRIAFSYMYGPEVDGESAEGLYVKTVGGGIEQRLLPEPEGAQIWPTDWSRDGKFIIYTTGNYIGVLNGDIWGLPLDGGDPIQLVHSPAIENDGVLSPNGKWLAYISDESGTREIYVIPFEPALQGTETGEAARRPIKRWQVSIGGGDNPVWRADGTELFYIDQNGTLNAVAVESDSDTFRVGATTPLFKTAYEPGKSLDVSPDGERFLINEVAGNIDTPVTIVVNWQKGTIR